MADSPAMHDQPFHVRSTSMPSRSHPTTLKVEEELRKLRSQLASSFNICTNFNALGEVYNSIDDLLHLPSIKQAFSHPNQKKWLKKELDRSVELLDLCGTLKDELAIIEEHVQNLKLALQRGKTTEEKIRVCIHSKTQKIVKKCQKALKKIEHTYKSCTSISEECELLAVSKVFKEAKEITVTLLCSVLLFLSMPKSNPRASKWFSVAKVMDKRKVACEEKNESARKVENVSFKDVEDGLECLFRRQIQNRVSLLNILSF